ncbi:rRNA maturation RNase YbeY [Amphritea balenae]|uniref:Endoribonuclease YbeY n=1 Tax=Amphritea balenae TaxID=452629 RepID=A0A3P1SMY4_9GAMM|nr:rRNA maturation RNase YbeY [Amphritea balenae]RRC98573.1 rRNA maturation RNase YbeY [Amphritea balenae]GGK65616.1 endoribonuclease YbeY [Amphritea balenae]
MTYYVDRQCQIEDKDLPDEAQLTGWVSAALANYMDQAELSIRIVSADESQALNHQYRGKDKPTNVLSFPFEVPEGVELDLLGDLVICAAVVEAEAKQQNKTLSDHWCHMVIHGVLHLLGFDHINNEEAEEMEQLERDILSGLNISDPYMLTE